MRTLLFVLAQLFVCLPVFGDDQAFVDGLLERRLPTLVETLCHEKLRQSTLSDRERTQWTIDLIRAQTQIAIHSTASDRGRAWERARQTWADYVREHRDSPHLILVQLQNALSTLVYGESLRTDAEFLGEEDTRWVDARRVLRTAVEQLEELDRALAAELPAARRKTVSADEKFSAEELGSLQFHVWAEIVRAKQNQALCYPDQSADRIAALTDAIGFAKRPLAQLAPDDPLAIRVRIEQAKCSRLMRDLASAKEAISGLVPESLSAATKPFALAELIRLRLAAGELEKAADFGSRFQSNLEAEPDSHLALFELNIAMWKAAVSRRDNADAKNRRAYVSELVQQIEHLHGPYWGRRAERLLLSVAKTIGGDQDYDLLRRSGDNLFLQGQFDEAILAYDVAASKANEAGDKDGVFDLAFKAAVVLQKQDKHADAAKRLDAIVTQFESHPHAASANLLRAWNLAQVVRVDESQASVYRDCLVRHLRDWPSDPTTQTASFWLGNFERQQRNWEGAVVAYKRVTADSPSHRDATVAIGECYENLLHMKVEHHESINDLRAECNAWFENVYLHSGSFPVELNEAHRAAILAASRIRLRYSDAKSLESAKVESAKQVESLLRRAMVGATPDFLNQAMPTLLLAIIEQPGRFQDAEQTVAQLASAPILQLIDLAVELNVEVVASQAKPAEKSQIEALAQVALMVIDVIWRRQPKLSDAQTRQLARFRAEALFASGQRSDGVDAYATLARTSGSDLSIQRRYAELLTSQTDPDSLRKAADQWRVIAKRCDVRSRDWYDAKYYVAYAYFRLGKKGEAEKLIHYLEATDGLGDGAIKERFQKLLEDCRRS